jgi:hypothetical protein
MFSFIPFYSEYETCFVITIVTGVKENKTESCLVSSKMKGKKKKKNLNLECN